MRRVVRHRARRRPRSPASTIGHDGGVTASSGEHVISTMPLRELVAELDPAAAGGGARPRRTAALPRLPHRRADRRRAGRCSRTTGSTSTTRRSSSAASRTSRTGARTWCPDQRKTCLGLEYFCFEGDDLWTMPDADLIALGDARARADRPARRRARSSTARVVRHAEGVSGLRRRLRRRAGDACASYLDALLEPAAGRPQRHAQVQQPGPLDGDGHARRRQPRRPAPRHLGGQQDDEYHEEGSQDEADVEADLAALESAQPRVPQPVR